MKLIKVGFGRVLSNVGFGLLDGTSGGVVIGGGVGRLRLWVELLNFRFRNFLEALFLAIVICVYRFIRREIDIKYK